MKENKFKNIDREEYLKNAAKFIKFATQRIDDQGRSYEDDYYVKCLSCGRCVLVGRCCSNYVTQSMKDKEKL